MLSTEMRISVHTEYCLNPSVSAITFTQCTLILFFLSCRVATDFFILSND